MAIPRVFISSTYYDLKYIRENLRYFIRTLGYEPTLSEDGTVFYNPRKHTHDSCLNEVPFCQMFVLIIGGRFGGEFKDSDKSITNEEYLEAVRNKIPVFALVEQSVYQEHHVYNENRKNNSKQIAEKIKYPSVNNVKIFGFIEEVRKNSINNAIVPFRDFSDIEDYLRKQWAGMMFNFLNEEIEENRVKDTLSALTKISENIEYLSRQILKTTATSAASAKAFTTVQLNDLFKSHSLYERIQYHWVSNPSLQDILKFNDIKNLLKEFSVKVIKVNESDKKIDETNETEYHFVDDGDDLLDYLPESEFNEINSEYKELRNQFEAIIIKAGISIEEFLEE